MLGNILKKFRFCIKKWLGIDQWQVLQKAIDGGLKLGRNVDLVSVPNFGSEPYLISIGDNTTVSFDCVFVTHDAATRVIRNLPDGNKETVIYGTITIGNNCFVGCRTTIIGGVEIGDNSIIGACSLVNRSIPSGVIAAGVPAKVICTLEQYRKKHEDDFLYMVSLPHEEKKKFLLRHFNIE